MSERRLVPDQHTYSQLLQVIGDAESKSNYNAYFGNAANTTIRFTDMTVAEVRSWQAQHVARGNASSAVGRYQIIDTTLTGLLRQLNINDDQAFDEAFQDKLAGTLLERRGVERYVNGELSTDQFAANLAMEWAALPKMIGADPAKSYYDGDGLNKALVTPETVRQSIESIRAI